MTTKFGIISDFHFGFPRYPGDTNFYSPQILKDSIEELNKIGDLNFVMQLGDLINENKNCPCREQDLISLDIVLEMISSLNAPVYHLVGNHDLITLKESDLEEKFGYKRLYYSFESDEFFHIALFTRSPGNTNIHLPDGEFEWIEQQLDQASKPILAFSHQHIVKHSLENSYWFKGNPDGAFIQDGEQIHQLFKNSGKVKAVFSGHMHDNHYMVKDGIPYFTPQSMIEDFNRDGCPAECFSVVSISKSEVTMNVHGRDSAEFVHKF